MRREGGGGGDSGTPIAEITAAVTTLIAALAALAVSGLLQRAQINHGRALTVAFAGVILGATLWLAATLPRRKRWEKSLRWAALGAVAIGVLFGVGAVIATQADPEVPRIAATLDPETRVLEATIQVRDVGSDDYLAVRVEGLQSLEPQRTLYLASLGPDVDGDIDGEIKIAVNADEFDAVGIKAYTSNGDERCSYARPLTEEGQGAGCVVFELRPVPTRPELTVRWHRQVAAVQVRASNIRTHVVVTRVVGISRSGRRRLAAFLAEPDATGTVDVTIRVPVPARFRRVCADARLAERMPRTPLRCPISGGDGPAASSFELTRWARLGTGRRGS